MNYNRSGEHWEHELWDKSTYCVITFNNVNIFVEHNMFEGGNIVLRLNAVNW